MRDDAMITFTTHCGRELTFDHTPTRQLEDMFDGLNIRTGKMSRTQCAAAARHLQDNTLVFTDLASKVDPDSALRYARVHISWTRAVQTNARKFGDAVAERDCRTVIGALKGWLKPGRGFVPELQLHYQPSAGDWAKHARSLLDATPSPSGKTSSKPRPRPRLREVPPHPRQQRFATLPEVVRQAEQDFPNLVFALNNASWVKDNPFVRPNDLYAALATLDRHAARLREGGAAENALGKGDLALPSRWRSKGSYSEVEAGRFRNEYRCMHAGIEYELLDHIGVGNVHDPRYTLRVAYAWSASEGRLVIGYIGLHQRNRLT